VAALTIAARDPRSLARAGVLRTAHGDVRTPAFVPLATKATVKGLLPEEVARLGYEMVLGNTFHLHLRPGEELIESLGGLHRFMDWGGPIITDSGGFQVFSMGHGTADLSVGERCSGVPRRAGGGGPASGSRRGRRRPGNGVGGPEISL
jgi:queuine tRNA-ribosyltransferase